MDLYEALYTTRAMRRVHPDPVPEDVVQLMLDAAIRAPSAGNTQTWRFVVVTDEATRATLGELYRDAWRQLNATHYAGRAEQARQRGDEQTLKVLSSAEWLAEHFAQVPLVVMAYHRNDPDGSTIFPAVWNMMLAARGQGVGTTLTTVLSYFKQDEVAELLGVPTDKGWRLAAAVTAGYPKGRWGIAKRPPVQTFVFRNRWGQDTGWNFDGPLWQPEE